ncbi:hypothetical protein V1517DRAFT_324756, partial [Lipomyces orientalis]
HRFNVYFPFVSNVYRHKKTGPVKQNNVKSEYYACRFFGEPSHDKNDRERRRREALEANPNLSTRHTARRNSGQCSFKFVLRVTCDIDGSPLLYRFEPKGQNHNHDLDRSDQLKRNACVREHLTAEAQRLYRPSEIIKSASETRSLLERQVLKTIGGNYVRNQEVINLQQK